MRKKIELTPDDMSQLNYLSANTKPDKSEQAINTYLTIKANDNYLDMVVMYEYFKNVYVCVDLKNCDPNNVPSSVLKLGKTFFQNYHDFFCSSFLIESDEPVKEFQEVNKYFLEEEKKCG